MDFFFLQTQTDEDQYDYEYKQIRLKQLFKRALKYGDDELMKLILEVTTDEEKAEIIDSEKKYDIVETYVKLYKDEGTTKSIDGHFFREMFGIKYIYGRRTKNILPD